MTEQIRLLIYRCNRCLAILHDRNNLHNIESACGGGVDVPGGAGGGAVGRPVREHTSPHTSRGHSSRDGSQSSDGVGQPVRCTAGRAYVTLAPT